MCLESVHLSFPHRHSLLPSCSNPMASLDLPIAGPTILAYPLLAPDLVGWEGLYFVVSLWRQRKGEAESGPCFPP